jgi:nitrite reductase/ring-hydroxylating ferredoxin subunit
VQVLSNTCSHLSAPLDEGELTDGWAVCPWHGSTFDLESGDVVHGPATAPQPKFETRVTGGMVEVQLQGAG